MMPTGPGMMPGAPMGAGAAAAPAVSGGPTGPGWVVRVTGYHYHNFDTARQDQGAEFVRNTLIEKLRTNRVALPAKIGAASEAAGEGQPIKLEVVSMEELGISHPVLVDPRPIERCQIEDPNAVLEEEDGKEGATPPTAGAMMPGKGLDGKDPRKMIDLLRFRFVVEFAWKEIPPNKRAEIKKAKLEAEQAQAQNAALPQP